MITKEKLALNLKVLKSKIPSKPEVYTKDHPKTIKDALIYYCNQRSIHSVQACTKSLNAENWPLPFWYNPENIKVGFWNWIYYRRQFNSWNKEIKFKGLKNFDIFWVPVLNHTFFKLTYDEILSEAFEANRKYAFHRLSANQILESKKIILASIRRSYKRQDWVACISIIFPVIDFVVRKILKTNHLSIDVSKICKLFGQNGFTIDNAEDLMPHTAFMSSYKIGEELFSKERKEWFDKLYENDFGLIGPPLSSFIRFSNIYYGYYKEDVGNPLIPILNRHAILHGSINQFGSRVNTIKLLTFLFLILELEPVFEILFDE